MEWTGVPMKGAAWVQTLRGQNKDEFLRVALLASISRERLILTSHYFSCAQLARSRKRVRLSDSRSRSISISAMHSCTLGPVSSSWAPSFAS